MRLLTVIASSLALVLVTACGVGAAPPPTPPAIKAATPLPTPIPPGGAALYPLPKPEMTIDPAKRYFATITTSKGPMEVELFASEAPVTVNNFVYLAEKGFYRDAPFHRVIDGFMIQTGDGQRGDGTGGPGYRFDDEPVSRPYTRGTVAMANAGPNTNGSQFFIMHRDYGLPPQYTIFGKLISGEETLDAIATTPVRRGAGGENSSPVERIVIQDVTIRTQ